MTSRLFAYNNNERRTGLGISYGLSGAPFSFSPILDKGIVLVLELAGFHEIHRDAKEKASESKGASDNPGRTVLDLEEVHPPPEEELAEVVGVARESPQAGVEHNLTGLLLEFEVNEVVHLHIPKRL